MNVITGLIRPITEMFVDKFHLHKAIADVLVIFIIILTCFIIGLVVKTRMGKFTYRVIEKRILKIAPGYSLFKETIKQFIGQEKTPFSSVALVRVFENSTMMTGFVTDEHPDGRYTVFVPSGLNPTSGIIYHLEKENVYLVDASVEDTMRSIISCGAGSKNLIKNYLEKNKKELKGEKND
jgi:uncharacterized membrane protein